MRSSTETIELSSDSDQLPMTSMDSVATEKKPNAVVAFLQTHKNTIRIAFKLIIHALIIVYFGFATNYYMTVTNGKHGDYIKDCYTVL